MLKKKKKSSKVTQGFDKRDMCIKHDRQIQAERILRPTGQAGTRVLESAGSQATWALEEVQGVGVALLHFPKWGSHRHQPLLLARVVGL